MQKFLLMASVAFILGSVFYNYTYKKEIRFQSDAVKNVKALDTDHVVLPTENKAFLAWDLNGDGKTEVSEKEKFYFLFSENADFKNATTWLMPEDGWMVFDYNANGTIDHAGEILTRAKLTALDFNGNGILEPDESLREIMIWQDINSNGVSEENEISPLTRFLEDEADLVLDNKNIVETSIQKHKIKTLYDGNSSFNLGVVLLPTLKGAGNVEQFSIALSQNETLYEYATILASYSPTDVIKNLDRISKEFDVLLFEWGRVKSVVISNLPEDVSPEKIAFLVKILGIDKDIARLKLNRDKIADLHHRYESVKVALLTRFYAQTDLGDIFNFDVTYNVIADDLQVKHPGPVIAFSEDFVKEIETLDQETLEDPEFWYNLAFFLKAFSGDLEGVSDENIAMIDKYIKPEKTGVNWAEIKRNYKINGPFKTITLYPPKMIEIKKP